MITLTTQLDGVEVITQRLNTLSSLHGLDIELEGAGDDIVKEAAQEPPERPGQRYVRSHKLSGGWKRSAARRTGSAVEVDVTNPMSYGPFVQGEDQAEIHKGRWKRIKAIGEEQRGAIRARVQSWALRTWRGA